MKTKVLTGIYCNECYRVNLTTPKLRDVVIDEDDEYECPYCGHSRSVWHCEVVVPENLVELETGVFAGEGVSNE